jgi:hypothetical protein
MFMVHHRLGAPILDSRAHTTFGACNYEVRSELADNTVTRTLRGTREKFKSQELFSGKTCHIVPEYYEYWCGLLRQIRVFERVYSVRLHKRRELRGEGNLCETLVASISPCQCTKHIQSGSLNPVPLLARARACQMADSPITGSGKCVCAHMHDGGSRRRRR